MDYTDFVVDRAQHMRPLEYDLSESYNNLVRYLNDMGILSNIPVGSIGPSEIVSASDALSAPLRSLVVGGNSMQNGTPTPAVPVAIQSVVNPVLYFCGEKNLINYNGVESQTINGVTFTKHPDGKWTVNGTATATTALNIGSITLIANRSYILSGCPADGSNSTYELMIMQNPTGGSGYYHDFGTGRSFSESTPVTRGIQIVIRSGYTANNLEFAPMVALGTTPTGYVPYAAIPNVNLPITLRGLPDGTRDSATYTYLRASERVGYAWYSGAITRRMGQTAQAATDGVTGTVGIDVLSTTGEIADGPTVIYKLAAPTTEQLAEVELPNAFGPNFTLWGTSDATPQLTAQYIRDLSAAINDMQEAIADI